MVFQIREDCKKINGILLRYCGEIKTKYKSLRGRAQNRSMSQSKKVYQFTIMKWLLASNRVRKELAASNAVVNTLSNKKEKLKEKHEEMSKELETLQGTKMQTEEPLKCAQNDYQKVLSENVDLREYIQKIGIQTNCKNTGKGIPNVGKRQQC